MRYLPLFDTDRNEMLRVIGAGSVDELFRDVPAEARLDGPIPHLPMHASEMAVERHMTALSRKNMVAGDVPFFLGCGAYKHHIPASVDHIIQRGEFLTSYTPYQPEIAQGTLQMLFEFQTQVARLFGCEVANASMYDGSTAMWEAIVMAHRITRRDKTIISSGVHPHYVTVAKTMAKFTEDELDITLPELRSETDAERLIASIDDNTSAVVVQYPDILGRIADLTPVAEAAHAAGALLIAVVTEPVALGLIKLAWRDGGGHRRWRRPVDRRWAPVWRTLCRPIRLPREARPSNAWTAGRRDCGRRGEARLCPHPLDARATYPPREGDIEHLHQLGALRARVHRAPDLARGERAAAARVRKSRARVRGGGAAGGDPGRGARQRPFLQRVHDQASGRSAAGGARNGRASACWAACRSGGSIPVPTRSRTGWFSR